jgi:hypothetical protein
VEAVERKTGIERRRFRRYGVSVKDDMFILFRPNFDRLGKVLDIGAGGLAFESLSFDENAVGVEVEIDIFASRPQPFHLHRVPCKVVYEIEVEPSELMGTGRRRCGVKFEKLTKRQVSQWSSVIDNCLLTHECDCARTESKPVPEKTLSISPWCSPRNRGTQSKGR